MRRSLWEDGFREGVLSQCLVGCRGAAFLRRSLDYASHPLTAWAAWRLMTIRVLVSTPGTFARRPWEEVEGQFHGVD